MAARASQRRGEATQEAILDATAATIVEKGLDGFTFSEVARLAGVNRALIYHYFKDRDTLISHAIDHMMSGFMATPLSPDVDGIERNARAYIEHPEISRFVFQLLLTQRPLLRVGERMGELISAVEELKERVAPNSSNDPAMGLIILALTEWGWSVGREEFARLLGTSVEEADERFIARLRYASAYAIKSLMDNDEAE